MSTSRPSELTALLAEQRLEIRQLRRRVRALEAICAEIQRVTIWDFAIYEQLPDERWVAIDRDEAGGMMRALEQVDSWRPWRTSIERRAS